MQYLGTALGATPGIRGDTTNTTADGVMGTSTTGVAAIYGTSSANGSAGIYGDNSANGNGVYGTNSGTGNGVYGYASGSAGSGVVGWSNFGYCVKGISNANGVVGIGGTTSGAGSYAIYGSAAGDNSIGIYATSFGTLGKAGRFAGDVHVTGTLTKAGGSFLIDHPLDPTGRTLEHSFVESPERKNVYDGVAEADAAGEIDVRMPPYFEALNDAFRYQLTPIGRPAPNLHIKEELANGGFRIAGAGPGQRVSWQVTGIRKDAWAKAHPLVVEEDKRSEERGLYLHPEAYGQPREKGVEAKRHPARPDVPPPPASPTPPLPPYSCASTDPNATGGVSV